MLELVMTTVRFFDDIIKTRLTVMVRWNRLVTWISIGAGVGSAKMLSRFKNVTSFKRHFKWTQFYRLFVEFEQKLVALVRSSKMHHFSSWGASLQSGSKHTAFQLFYIASKVPYEMRYCAIPPDHLRSESSFLRTCSNPNLKVKNH